MNDPGRVRVTGPLAPFTDGFSRELETRGYAPGSVALQLQLMAQLSRWLEDQRLGVSGLTRLRVEEFFQARRARVRALQVSPTCLRVLFGHLGDVGVLPAEELTRPGPVELLVGAFGRFLLQERALEVRTVQRYQYVAGRFLAACAASDVAVAGIGVVTITAFMTAECKASSNGWSQCVATALRSLLRYLYLEQMISTSLAGSVPAVAGWRAASLPKALTAAELASLLAVCSGQSNAARRDYAVLLMAGRLGLRAGEIAGLGLRSINWEQGELRVLGKGRRVDLLPVPVDVGRALATYVRHGRVAAGDALFQHLHAPHGRLAPASVTGIVYRACDRAGLPRVGAHRLRHTAATQMLRAGASLPEIAQVLRHRSPDTTALYAKVDRRALAELARPWPAGAA